MQNVVLTIDGAVVFSSGNAPPGPGPGPVPQPPPPVPPPPSPPPAGLQMITEDFDAPATFPMFMEKGVVLAVHFVTPDRASPSTVRISNQEMGGQGERLRWCLSETAGDFDNPVRNGNYAAQGVAPGSANVTCDFAVDNPGSVSGGGTGFVIGPNLERAKHYYLNCQIIGGIADGEQARRSIQLQKFGQW